VSCYDSHQLSRMNDGALIGIHLWLGLIGTEERRGYLYGTLPTRVLPCYGNGRRCFHVYECCRGPTLPFSKVYLGPFLFRIVHRKRDNILEWCQRDVERHFTARQGDLDETPKRNTPCCVVLHPRYR